MLHSDYKRTLDEIIEIYKREPTIKDIYVEGPRDKAFFDFFIEELNLDDLKVKLIENIQLPKKIKSNLCLRFKKYDTNMKDKIIITSHEFELNYSNIDNARFLADKDFDHFLLKLCNLKFLLYTDYTCMDMYLFNSKLLKNFFRFTLKPLPKSSIVDIMNEFVIILEKMFLLRLARMLLKIRLDIDDFTSYCKMITNDLVFNLEEFLDNKLINKPDKLAKLNKKISELEPKLTNNPKNQMYKKDLIKLILFYYHEIGEAKRKRNEQAILDSLYQCLRIDYIIDEPLFKTILKWYENRN